ncbi:hypothetical protein CUN67_22900 (plasmid) [Pantoea cypripedii]|uniref:Uncharacterized protein n=1 Tax=Pantoea cypripedii TaxID=55209 RepID=A0A6B9G2Z3_PANCY|nr:hypothetical protein CUN67_22900 [Pantoea cypripedii]
MAARQASADYSMPVIALTEIIAQSAGVISNYYCYVQPRMLPYEQKKNRYDRTSLHSLIYNIFIPSVVAMDLRA